MKILTLQNSSFISPTGNSRQNSGLQAFEGVGSASMRRSCLEGDITVDQLRPLANPEQTLRDALRQLAGSSEDWYVFQHNTMLRISELIHGLQLVWLRNCIPQGTVMKIRPIQTCIMSSLPRCMFRCRVFRYVISVSFVFN